MSQLTLQPFLLPAANLGGENPLAPIRPYETASAAGMPISRGTEERYPDWGEEASILPYRLHDDAKTPVLRLYEWERIRRVPFQIDCWLPDGSQFLFVRVRITNPNEHTVPMYWWSNIGVPEREDVRVLGPADQALRHDYDGK